MNQVRARWAAFGAAVAVALGGGVGFVNAALSEGERSVFVSLDAPCRLLDLRPDSQVGPRSTPLEAGETYVVMAHGAQGNCTIPDTASKLLLNLTAAGASSLTNVRVFPAGAELPTASNLNPSPGQPPTPNAVTTALDANGRFAIYNAFGAVFLLADVVGFYTDHNHDDRYYTEAESNDRYYTKAQVDATVASIVAPGEVPAQVTRVVQSVTDPVTVDGGVEVVGSIVVGAPAAGAVVVTAAMSYTDANLGVGTKCSIERSPDEIGLVEIETDATGTSQLMVVAGGFAITEPGPTTMYVLCDRSGLGEGAQFKRGPITAIYTSN